MRNYSTKVGMLGLDPYGVQPRFLKFLGPKQVIEASWGGVSLTVHQLFYGYDTKTTRTEGMILTTFDFREYGRRRPKNRWRNTLYIKARTSLGLWELTMEKTHLKDLGRQAYWFRYDGAASHTILEKPTK